jgi:hypothetical protein
LIHATAARITSSEKTRLIFLQEDATKTEEGNFTLDADWKTVYSNGQSLYVSDSQDTIVGSFDDNVLLFIDCSVFGWSITDRNN